MKLHYTLSITISQLNT